MNIAPRAAGSFKHLARFIFVSITIMLLFSRVAPVLAITQLDTDAINNNWVNWVPGDFAPCSTTSSTGSVTLTGSGDEQQAFNFFVSQGLAPYQSAGIVGNMEAESGVQPERLQNTASGVQTPASAVDPNGGLGWGLVQWTPPGKFITPTLAANLDPNQLSVQLTFLWQELQPTGSVPAAGTALRQSTDVDSAANAFLTQFEKPAGVDDPTTLASIEGVRDPMAEQVLAQYGNGAPSGASSTNSSGCPSSIVTSSGGYQNPFHDMTNVEQSRIDEGVDYVAAPGTSVGVYAIGNGVVTIATSSSSFFTTSAGNADWITYQLTDGPAMGDYIYVSEGCDHISVTVGSVITPNTLLCDMEPDSIETGWASSASVQTPAASSVYQEGYETAYGVNFNQLLVSLGAPPGHLDTSNDPGGVVLGSLPASWPTW